DRGPEPASHGHAARSAPAAARRRARGRVLIRRKTMKLHVAALALALIAAPAPVALAQDGGKQPAPAEALDARVERLVRQLGDRAYERREQAQRELVAIGRPALPALREAAKSQDPEVASRAA